MPRGKSRSPKLKFKTWWKQWLTSCWLRADKGVREKNYTYERIQYFVKWWLQSCKSFGQYLLRVVLLAEKSVVMRECESRGCQGLKYCTSLEWQEALIYWHSQCVSSGTDWAIPDWGPLNHCTVRFRLSSPFDSQRWVVLFPPPPPVSSFVRPKRYIRIFVALL